MAVYKRARSGDNCLAKRPVCPEAPPVGATDIMQCKPKWNSENGRGFQPRRS